MSTQTVVREGTILAPGEVVRYNFNERVCHWVNGVTYLFCMLTGLAFYSPYLYWFSVVGGGPVSSRFLHPWVGVFFFVAVLWMHALWKLQMIAAPEDKAWKDGIKNYIENRDDLVPPQGRFNAGQKLFYWVMFYSAIVLLITGVIMWFPELIAGRAHWLLTVIIPIHCAAALLTIGAFIIHIYMGLLLVPGGLKGILYGRVSGEWAAHHHRLWYEKIKKQ
ncbi:MAG TPA: formate dehydrogenase subunit gamma [Candidatus Angelobacter sp.]